MEQAQGQPKPHSTAHERGKFALYALALVILRRASVSRGDGAWAICDNISHLSWLYDRRDNLCGTHRRLAFRKALVCLERNEQMEKVIIPTVFGFASMMGLWVIVGALV